MGGWEQRLKRAAAVFYPLLALGLIVLGYKLVAPLRTVTVADLLAYTPRSYWLAIPVILGAYLIKSLTVVFPLYVLYVAVGTLFPPLWGVGINLLGLALCVLLPWGLGRLLGREPVERLLIRHPKGQELMAFGGTDGFFLSFVLRVINLLPGDLVSLSLGALGVPLSSYLTGSLLGLLPGMLPATLLGRSLGDSGSRRLFLPSLLLSLLMGAGVLLFRRYWGKRGGKTDN